MTDDEYLAWVNTLPVAEINFWDWSDPIFNAPSESDSEFTWEQYNKAAAHMKELLSDD